MFFRILILEDEVFLARDVADKLGNLGHSIIGPVTNEPSATNLLASQPIDIIVMDIMFDGKPDGIAIAERLYRQFDVPVVFLGGFANEEILIRAERAHHFGFLVLPYYPNEVNLTLRTAILRFKLEKELRQNQIETRNVNAQLEVFFENSPEAHFFASIAQPIDFNQLATNNFSFSDFFSQLRVSRVNRSFTKLLNRNGHEIMGRELKQIFNFDAQQISNIGRGLLKNNNTQIELKTDNYDLANSCTKIQFTLITNTADMVIGIYGSLMQCKQIYSNNEIFDNLRPLIQQMADDYIAYDDKGIIIDTSPLIINTLGIEQKELFGMAISSICDSENLKRLGNFQYKLPNQKTKPIQIPLKTKSGFTNFNLRYVSYPFSGSIISFLLIDTPSSDLPNHILTQTNKNDDQLTCQLMLAEMPLTMLLVDTKTLMVLANSKPNAFAINKPIIDVLEQIIPEIVRKNDFGEWQHAVVKAITENLPLSYLFNTPSAPKGYQLIELKTDRILANEQYPNGLSRITIQDISASKSQEEILHDIVEEIIIGVAGKQGRYFFETAAESLARYFEIDYTTISEIATNNRMNTVAVYDRGELLENYSFGLANTPCEKTLNQGFLYIENNLNEQFGNHDFFIQQGLVSYLGYALVNSEGQKVGVIDFMNRTPIKNIKVVQYTLSIFSARVIQEMERINSSQKLKESQESLQALIENSNDIIFAINRKSELLISNSAFNLYYLIKYNISPKLGQVVFSQDEASEWREFFERCFEGERFVRTLSLNISDHQRDLDVSFNPIISEIGTIIGVSILTRDVTDRRASENQLRASQANLVGLVENTDDIIFLVDKHLNIAVANLASKRFFRNYYEIDFGPEQNMGNNQFSKIFNPNWLPAIHQAMAGNRFSRELDFNAENNKTFYEVVFNPVYSEDGYIVGVSVLGRDVSSRKKYETELERKNFELDSFVYKAAHDLRAPLKSVRGLVNILRMEDDPMLQQSYLNLIESSVFKLEDFIRELSNYSRNTRFDLEAKPVFIKQIIEKAIENIKYLDGTDRVEFKLSINQTQPFYTDDARLSVIFQNIFVNAVQFRNQKIENCYVSIEAEITPRMAMMKIEDNGVGINPETLNKIFDMFYTTSGSAGTGLGLYIVKQVLEKMGGNVKVDSKVDRGTSFFIQLPPLTADVK